METFVARGALVGNRESDGERRRNLSVRALSETLSPPPCMYHQRLVLSVSRRHRTCPVPVSQWLTEARRNATMLHNSGGSTVHPRLLDLLHLEPTRGTRSTIHPHPPPLPSPP